MSGPFHSLLKSAEVADLISLSMACQGYWPPFTADRGLTTQPSWGSCGERPAISACSAGADSYQAMQLGEGVTQPRNKKFCEPALFKKASLVAQARSAPSS